MGAVIGSGRLIPAGIGTLPPTSCARPASRTPSLLVNSALDRTGVARLAPQMHRDQRRGHCVGRRRPEGPPAAGRWTAASKRVRSRSVSSWAARMCLVTNGEYTDSIRRFRDIVTGIAGRGRTHTIPRKLEHCRRSGRRVDETPRIPRVTRRAIWRGEP